VRRRAVRKNYKMGDLKRQANLRRYLPNPPMSCVASFCAAAFCMMI
jgi:hypothetical protein